VTETVAQWVLHQLEERGMFENDAARVLAKLKDDPTCAAMRGRWDHPISDYPAPLLATVLVAAKAEGLKWIDENCPRHWARPLFAESATA
jgi:hypothetical protein